ncbi:MAG: hypothetical protein AAGH17_06130, partial [Pseudomonadota bacterium]
SHANMANTLSALSIRVPDPESVSFLAQAVASYEAALSIYTPRDHPLDWAMTQNNKGLALQTQGTRATDADSTLLFDEAAIAHNNALKVYTKTEYPVQWAITQNNKANALQLHGARRPGLKGVLLFQQSISAYEAALEVRIRADHPVAWATTHENLAIVRKAMARNEEGSLRCGNLMAALKHVDAALEVFDPEHMSFNHEKASALREDILAALAKL